MLARMCCMHGLQKVGSDPNPDGQDPHRQRWSAWSSCSCAWSSHLFVGDGGMWTTAWFPSLGWACAWLLPWIGKLGRIEVVVDIRGGKLICPRELGAKVLVVTLGWGITLHHRVRYFVITKMYLLPCAHVGKVQTLSHLTNSKGSLTVMEDKVPFWVAGDFVAWHIGYSVRNWDKSCNNQG